MAADATGMLNCLSRMAGYFRKDIYAERFHSVGEWRYRPVKIAIDEDVLQRHLSNNPNIGMYLFEAGGSSVRIAAFDLDDHDKVVAWDRMRLSARDIMQTAKQFGLVLWPIRSGGGSGVHLFARWDSKQSAAGVRRLMQTVLAACGLREGPGGVAREEIEIFPKQDAIAEDGFGALIALPFGRSSTPLDAQLLPCDEITSWTSSAPVVRPVETDEGATEQRVGAGVGVEAGVVLSALAAIPNKDLDYETWIRVGLALKSGLNETGKQAFLDWSAQSSKNDPSIAARKWNSFKPSKVTVGTLFWMARKLGWKDPISKSVPYSEDALALGFSDKNVDDLRYSVDWNRWLHWDGNRWREDKTLETQARGRDYLRDVAATVNKNRKAIVSNKMLSNMLSMARTDHVVPIDVWDRDPWLLCTPGGTLDLKTGELSPSSRDHYITKSTRAIPNGVSPSWMTFLEQVCLGDREYMDYLQTAAGYCLTGSVREECLFFLIGDGGNGKGTFVETLNKILGDHSTTVAMNTLVATKHQEHATELAKLRGVRLAVSSETSDGARWNVARIKLLTGGDVLTARFMRQDFFDFNPTHKLLISSNSKPMLGRVDHAIERRMHLCPFNASIAVPDKLLKSRLLAEASGILQWMVEGCVRWQRHGLVQPALVKAATVEYLESQDDLVMCLEEGFTSVGGDTRARRNAKVSASVLFTYWQDWCQRNGSYAGSAKDFGERMTQKGFERVRVHGAVFYTGLRQGVNHGSADFPDEDKSKGLDNHGEPMEL